MLLPTGNTSLRRSLDEWFEANGLRPNIIGEFEDSALLKVFGLRGAGVFPAPSFIAKEIERQFNVCAIGKASGIRERFYAVTIERRIKHPAVVAICDSARMVLPPDGVV